MGNQINYVVDFKYSKNKDKDKHEIELEAYPLLEYTLFLSNSKLKDEDLEEALFSHLSSSSGGGNISNKLQTIEILNLSCNILTSVKPLIKFIEKYSKNKKLPNLKSLDLSKNGLVNIKDIDFNKYFPNLQELYLHNNYLIGIDKDKQNITFPKNLKILDISKNCILNIDVSQLPNSIEELKTNGNLF